jgi:hypothetical protein
MHNTGSKAILAKVELMENKNNWTQATAIRLKNPVLLLSWERYK